MNPNMENTNPHKMEADSRDTSYVPREHVPRQNNTGPQNERTNEIVVSGDTKHVLRNLAKELESRDDDRWHILAIPESNILGLEETSGEAVGQNTIGEASRDRVPLQRPGQVLVSLSTTDLALFQEYLARRLQARQPDSHTTNQSSEDQDPSLWFNTNPSSGPTPPSPRTQAAIMEALAEDGCLQNRSSGPDVGHMKELALDAHTLNNDSWSEAWRMEDKTGTGECGWCDRRGHEAIDCIRWDPIHFDKGVCVLCNNRLHGIDECVRFEELDLLEQANLILDMGRMKPGVRSVANSWVRVVRLCLT